MKRIILSILLLTVLTVLKLFPQNRIAGYRYWFDQDINTLVEEKFDPVSVFRMADPIPARELGNGLHLLQFSFLDTEGKWSVPLSRFFLKNPSLPTPGRQIIACQYWAGNAFDQAVTISLSGSEVDVFDTHPDLTQLPSGLHVIHFRFLDNAGQWSSPVNRFFLKTDPRAHNASVTAYRYWLDDDFDHRREIETGQPLPLILIETELDMTQIWKGNHTVFYQFRDNMGKWSSVLSHVFEKSPLPLADFEMSTTFYCDSTLLHLTNHSVDADEYLWDFGDGQTSTEEEPTHKYITPGTYAVTLTVTENQEGTTDVMEKEITVEGHTENQIAAEACIEYVSPSGQYIWTESGTYNDTIPNILGCDSVLIIDLTVKTVNTEVVAEGITLTARASGASFRWLDCQDGFSVIEGETSSTFTPSENGEYAVEVTQEGCTDTSACYAVTGVYILSPGNNSPVSVYPNPSHGFFTIDLGKNEDHIRVLIRTIKGKILSVHEFRNTGQFDMMVPGAPGYYLLEIRCGSGKPFMVKVMKE